MRTDEPVTMRRLDYTPPDYWVDQIDLSFELDPARTLVRAQLPQVESMLADGRPWLLGTQPTVADLAVYHPLWFFTARTQRLAHELLPYVRIGQWMQRVRAFGHGSPTPMSSQDALEMARTGRLQILDFMDTVIAAPRAQLSRYAPRY